MSFCLGFFQSYCGLTEKKPISADLGSMPLARRTWRVASACLPACVVRLFGGVGLRRNVELDEGGVGAVSNLPSAPT